MMLNLQLLAIWSLILAISCQNQDLQTSNTSNTSVTVNNKNHTCTDVDQYDADDDTVEGNIFAEEFSAERDALEVHDLLKAKIERFSIQKFFKFSGMHRLRVRANLPFVKSFIRGKVDQFHQLDLRLVFKLLAKIGQVLRVAYAGCKGHSCNTNVYNLMLRYQELIVKTKRLSKLMVLRTIRALEYHWYAYSRMTKKQKDKAVAQLGRTIPIAKRIRNESSVVVMETEELKTMSKDAAGQVGTDLKVTEQEAKAFEDEKKKYKDEEIQYSKNVDSLKKKVEDYKGLIASIKVEESKIDTKEEFVRKKKITSQKCELVQSDKFETICDTVHVLFIGVQTCEVHKGKMSSLECRQYLDKNLLDFRREQLKRLFELRRELRNKRIQIAEQKLKVQLMQREQFAALQAVGKKLAQLTKEEVIVGTNLQTARNSLDLAFKAMIIVQSQLIKMVDFWNNVVLHTQSIVQEARDNTTDDDTNGLKERIMTSGFSWLALGKVLRIAHHELKMTSHLVSSAFMTFPTSAEVSGVINNEAKDILSTTIELADKYTARIQETEDRILKLMCEKKKRNESEEDDFDEYDDFDDNSDPDAGIDDLE